MNWITKRKKSSHALEHINLRGNESSCVPLHMICDFFLKLCAPVNAVRLDDASWSEVGGDGVEAARKSKRL